MMFFLVSMMMRFERLILSFFKPFYAVAGIEPARSAIIFIVLPTWTGSPRASHPSSTMSHAQLHHTRIPAPAYARTLS